jgi:hypothetical protein
MNATIQMPYVLSLAMGKPQIAARLNLYALVAVLPVTAALILLFGLPGAGFSWVFYHLFAYAYMVPRISRECLHRPVLTWHLHVLKVVGLAAVTYGLAWLVIDLLQAFSLPALVLAYAAASIAFGAGAYLSIDPDLKDTIRRFRGTLMVRHAGAPGPSQG